MQDVDLELEKGKIIGLVGENGSGKSTTLKLVAGLVQPTKGTITVNEKKVDRRIAAEVSYLSELDEYYRFYTVRQTIDFFCLPISRF